MSVVATTTRELVWRLQLSGRGAEARLVFQLLTPEDRIRFMAERIAWLSGHHPLEKPKAA